MATAKFSSIKLILLTSLITFIFCISIALNISPLLRGPAPYPPEWQWTYQFANTLEKAWAPLIAGVLGMLGLFYFDREKWQVKKFFSEKFLTFIIILTLLLQLSILFFSRSGVNVLLERIINPGISGYFTTALSVKNIPHFLSSYQDNVARFPMRAADHPPFAVLFFSLILFTSQHLQFVFPIINNLHIRHNDVENIWKSLLTFQKTAAIISTVLIPILSSIVLIPLFFLTKYYYDIKIAVRACILYSFFPSVSLFLPLNDVFLGIFGTFGGFFVLLGEKKHWFYYLLSGFIFSIGIFFSLSMIVPVLISFFLLTLSKFNVRQKILGALDVLVGLSAIPLILFFFHFNTLTVFAELTALQAKRSYLPWIFYDLYDFFIFSGIPVLIYSIAVIKKLLESRFRENNILAISFFLVIFLLDLSGFSRAETGRIWMPYMPFLAMIIAGFLTKKQKLNTVMFASILLLQLIQLMSMTEFWVTLW